MPGQTVFDVWDRKIGIMGSGSDFTAFQDFAGIPSLDVGFGSDGDDSIYQYHSNYDSFHWMEKFGDPGFVYHRTMAQIFGLIVAPLVDLPVLSMSAREYAIALDGYVDKVESKLESVLSPKNVDISAMTEEQVAELRGRRTAADVDMVGASKHLHNKPTAETFKYSLHRLHRAAWRLIERAADLDDDAHHLAQEVREHIPWWRWPARLRLMWAIRQVNTKYKYLERKFLYDIGLDGRPWFKHVIFAPGLWTGYAGGEFFVLIPPLNIVTY